MSRWAEDAFEKVTAQESAQKRKEDLDGQCRAQIMAGAPPYWRELKDALRNEDRAFSKLKPNYLSVEDIPGLETTNLFITSPKGRMELKFDSSEPAITFSITPTRSSGIKLGDLNGSLRFEPTLGSGVAAKDKDGVCYGTQDMAEYLLNLIV